MHPRVGAMARQGGPVERVRPPRGGGLPQPSLVPPPRGITLRPAALATRSARANSSALAGWMTICAGTPSTASAGGAPRQRAPPPNSASPAPRGAPFAFFAASPDPAIHFSSDPLL